MRRDRKGLWYIMSKMFVRTNLFLKELVVGFCCLLQFVFLIKNIISMTEEISWNSLCEASVALSFSFWRSVVSIAYYFNFLANSKQYFRIMIVAWWLFQASADKLKLILAVWGNKRKYILLKLLLSQCQLLICGASCLCFYQPFSSTFFYADTSYSLTFAFLMQYL